MKRDKIILNIIILSIIILILSGCVTPTAPNIPDQGDGINHSPIISDLSISPRTAFINQNIIITCTASDQDGDTLTYSWSSSPGGTITGSGSTITWIAPATEGTYTITCMVSDGKGGEDSKSVGITVASDSGGVRYSISWSEAESNGWKNPLGEGKELITSTAYDYDSGIYLYNHPEKKHMGIDIVSEENDKVYAIASGTIRKIERGSDPKKMVVIIKHTNSNNKDFFAIYGHVLARSDLEVEVNSEVKAGEKIGVVKKSGSPCHLHFGVNLSSEFIDDLLAGKCGWGLIPESANPSEYDWVDPIDHLTTYLPLSRLTPEEIELIRKWGYGGDYVVRWPNGYVDIYDATNYSRMQEIINEWNAAIGGPVILRLSSNPNSPVKVIFDSSLDEENLCGNANEIWGDDYAFSEITIKVNPSESCCGSYNIKYCLYLVEFNAVAGFNYAAEVSPVPFEDWSNFSTIPDTIKTMVHALYKVPSGYYLGIGNPKMGYSPTIIENMQLGIDSGCVSNCKK